MKKKPVPYSSVPPPSVSLPKKSLGTQSPKKAAVQKQPAGSSGDSSDESDSSSEEEEKKAPAKAVLSKTHTIPAPAKPAPAKKKESSSDSSDSDSSEDEAPAKPVSTSKNPTEVQNEHLTHSLCKPSIQPAAPDITASTMEEGGS
ncbi:Nucleolar phosphoprotein p130 [Cricetulus griseus]|uniref:Nucleolar phosphoprotein p130 n=1 Tax=Cricetulus griseus TaxID=10029 RepID=G3IB15_CRIGR|nr:Nucleolar phosphoprotein p130 [Cricetulus griseus]